MAVRKRSKRRAELASEVHEAAQQLQAETLGSSMDEVLLVCNLRFDHVHHCGITLYHSAVARKQMKQKLQDLYAEFQKIDDQGGRSM